MTDITREHIRFLGAIFITTMAAHATMLINAMVGGSLLGANAVSALELVMPFWEVFYGAQLLFGMGACTAASFALGKGDLTSVRRHFTTAVISLFTISILIGIVLFLCRSTIVNWLCGDSHLHENTYSYLTVSIPFFVFWAIFYLLKLFTSMTGRPHLVMYCSLLVLLVNLTIGIVLIKWGGLGIEALAYSSTVAVIIGISVLLPNYFKHHSLFRMMRCSMAEFLHTLQEDIHYGKGLLTTDLAYIIFSFLMNFLVLRYMGEQGLYGWSVVMMLFLVGDYAETASQETCISLGGKYIGLGNHDKVRLIYRRSLYFAITWIVSCLVLVFLLPNQILPLFGANDTTACSALLPIIALTVPFILGNNMVNLYLVRLISCNKILLFMTLSSLLYLSVPLMLFFAHILIPQHEWFCFLAMIPIQVLLCYVAYRYHRLSRTQPS